MSDAATDPVVRAFLVVLGLLLLGYMFLGRGFAHLGIGPIYVGDAVLAIGVAVTAYSIVRYRLRPPLTWALALLLGFAVLGAIRTVPYLGRYEIDALRDGVLWGYAAFALIVYVLVDRRLLWSGFRAYAWIVPAFALWLPISWSLFVAFSAEIDPNRPAAVVPLVFFKAGDMAVHIVGALAFLVIGLAPADSRRQMAWRIAIALPLLWTSFIAIASNRGALVTIAVGIVALVALAPRWRRWAPIVAAAGVLAVALGAQSAYAALTVAPPTAPTPGAAESSERAQTSALEPGAASASPSTSARSPAASGGIRGSSEPSSSAAEDGEPGLPVEIENEGFELTATPPTIPGWGANAGARVTIGTVGSHGGTSFAVMANTRGRYEAALTSDAFPLDGGDVRATLWAKVIDGEPILEVYINLYDEADELISSRFMNRFSSPGDSAWHRVAGVVVGRSEAVSGRVVLYEASGGGTLGIDDVVVRTGDFASDVPTGGAAEGRTLTIDQILDNIGSIFGGSSDGGLEGTRQFRLAWWGTIVDYTLFGDYFWAGKGFGVNLADSDGFQSTADGSLRAPHNTHFTVLARMGVPGFVVWVAFLGVFGVGLLRATLRHRRAQDVTAAAVGAWALAYWFAMLVDTSFDPYLEGPQGGIWFWAIIGVGLVVMTQRRDAVR
jgi:hypothetical protein